VKTNLLAERRKGTELKKKSKTCDICGVKYTNSSSMKKHRIRHFPDQKKYVCSVESCDKRFFELADLQRHEKTCKSLKNDHCIYCGKHVVDLNEHYQKCTKYLKSQYLHPCRGCMAVFQTEALLDKHLQECTKVVTYQCDICFSNFTARHSLLVHLAKHNKTGLASYFCDICDMKFNKKFLLKFHMKTHEPDKPCPYCQQMVPGGAHEKKLCRARRSSNISQCPYCIQTLHGGKPALYRHVVRKHQDMENTFKQDYAYFPDIKIWKCKYCEKNMKNFLNLESHEKRCKDRILPDLFKCDGCDKGFHDIDKAQEHCENCRLSLDRSANSNTLYKHMEDGVSL